MALKNEIMWMYNLPDWKVDVVYNGVNVHNFDGEIDPGEVKARYGIAPLDPTILFAARMVHQKGPDILASAALRCLWAYRPYPGLYSEINRRTGTSICSPWQAGGQ